MEVTDPAASLASDPVVSEVADPDALAEVSAGAAEMEWVKEVSQVNMAGSSVVSQVVDLAERVEQESRKEAVDAPAAPQATMAAASGTDSAMKMEMVLVLSQVQTATDQGMVGASEKVSVDHAWRMVMELQEASAQDQETAVLRPADHSDKGMALVMEMVMVMGTPAPEMAAVLDIGMAMEMDTPADMAMAIPMATEMETLTSMEIMALAMV